MKSFPFFLRITSLALLPLLSSCFEAEIDPKEEISRLGIRIRELETSLNKLRNERDHYANQYQEFRERAIEAEVTLEELNKSRSEMDKNEVLMAKAEAAAKAKEEERELRRIQTLISQQESLLKAFVGSTFETLKTTTGREYTAARVISATPMDISIMHQAGKATLSYEILPSEIAEQCGYNEETAKFEVQRRAKENNSQPISSSIQTSKIISSHTQKPQSDNLKNQSTKKDDLENARGVIAAKILKSYIKYGNTYKNIEITVHTNVYARLSMNPGSTYTISPNSTQSYSMTSAAGGSYQIFLKSMDGTILDSKASSGRKVGL